MGPADTLRGTGLLPSTIDAFAQAKSLGVYASVPVDDYDLSKGFRDIDYRAFADAIDRAAFWLDDTLGRVQDKYQHFPTFSYEGPKDLRFPILTVAAIKTGRTVSLSIKGMPPLGH